MNIKKTIAFILAAVTVCALFSFVFASAAGSPATEPADESKTEIITEAPAVSENGDIQLPESIPTYMIRQLKNYLEEQQFSCGLYYIDLKTGFSLGYNEMRIFGAASMIKAPYMMYILDMIESGELHLDDKIQYLSKHKWGGTGQIQDLYKPGDFIDLEKIIQYTIIDSDNIGFRMLNYAYDDTAIMTVYQFHQKAKVDYGATFYSGIYGSVLQAKSVAVMFAEAWRRAESGDELYQWFLSLLKQANENKFIRNGLPKDDNGECIYEVAHKYGEDTKAMSDAAIVFAGERPYVLVITTDWLGDGAYYHRIFMNNVSSYVYSIHEYLVNPDNWSE